MGEYTAFLGIGKDEVIDFRSEAFLRKSVCSVQRTLTPDARGYTSLSGMCPLLPLPLETGPTGRALSPVRANRVEGALPDIPSQYL